MITVDVLYIEYENIFQIEYFGWTVNQLANKTRNIDWLDYIHFKIISAQAK